MEVIQCGLNLHLLKRRNLEMKFGLNLPFRDARDVPHRARLAEQAGWDGVFLGDAIWMQDPMVTLGAAAVVTQRIRLGTLVIPVPLRQPWKLANEASIPNVCTSPRRSPVCWLR